MANKGPSYGLSLDCEMKAQKKFSLELAVQAIDWIQAVTELNLAPSSGRFEKQSDFQEVLRDGVALCHLINRLKENSVRRINTSKIAFKQMENIEQFLIGCTNYGMKENDKFQTDDLYDGRNMYLVVNCLHILGGLAQKNSFDGPTIGVRIVHENKRNFDDEVMRKGEGIVGLQAGFTQGASQKGMGAYGANRGIYMSSLNHVKSREDS